MEITQTSLTEIQNLRSAWGRGQFEKTIFFKGRVLFQTAAKGPGGKICYDLIGRGSFKLQMNIKLRLYRYLHSANV